MNKVELIINKPSQAYLDMGDFDISLNYSFNDIRDISKRNGSYSKTLILPGSKNNNFILGGLYDINAEFTLFNPNKKTDARLLVNSELVIDGFLHLTNIKKLANVDSQGNTIFYEMVIYSNSIDLIAELGNSLISDVTLTEFNHNYSETNIISSWSNTEGYVYPMTGIQSNDNKYKSKHFYPAVFYKTVLNQMITEAGYGWTGSLKTNTQFEKEIIPYTGNGTPKISNAGKERKELDVSVTENNDLTFTDANSSGVGDWKIGGFTDAKIPFDIINNDPTNQYSNQFIWTVGVGGEYSLSLNLKYEIDFYNPKAYTVYANYSADVKYTLQKLNNGSWIGINSIVSEINGPLDISATSSVIKTVNVNESFNSAEFASGDKLRIVISVYKTTTSVYVDIDNVLIPGVIDTELTFVGTSNKLSINSLTSTVGVGDNVILTDFLPKLKQKDLLTDLIKRYNLVIYQDPDNPKMVILDSYNEYYLNNTEVLDWSSKKDYSNEDTIKLLSELQFKTALFSYTPETTALDVNVDYTDVVNEVYGELEYEFDNDFVKGTQNIISPFSPTPTIKTGFGAYLPSINRENPKGRPRVLYYGGLKSLAGSNNWSFNGSYSNDYPYAGHFDDPVIPTLDLNFDYCRYYFHNDMTLTSNNQFNTYWSSYFKQIQTGKLLTAYFKLDETDIRKVRDNLSYKIWIKDSYYYINKIIGYNPMSNGVTKVELIKAVELGYYADEGSFNFQGGISCPTDLYVQSYGSLGNITRFYKSYTNQVIDVECCTSLGGNYNAANGSCELNFTVTPSTPIVIRPGFGGNIFNGAMVIGSGNLKGGTKLIQTVDKNGNPGVSPSDNTQLIVGDDNIVTSDKVLVLGDNNQVNNSSVAILNGSGNVISSINTTLIGTSDKEIDEPNKVYLGNKFNVDTITGEYFINDIKSDTIYTKTVRVPSSVILELDTTPFELLDSPGLNKYYEVLNVNGYLEFATAYDNDSILEVYIENADINYFEAENVFAESSSGIYIFKKVPPTHPETQSKINEKLLFGLSQEVTSGTSDLILTFNYKIVDLNNI